MTSLHLHFSMFLGLLHHDWSHFKCHLNLEIKLFSNIVNDSQSLNSCFFFKHGLSVNEDLYVDNLHLFVFLITLLQQLCTSFILGQTFMPMYSSLVISCLHNSFFRSWLTWPCGDISGPKSIIIFLYHHSKCWCLSDYSKCWCLMKYCTSVSVGSA